MNFGLAHPPAFAPKAWDARYLVVTDDIAKRRTRKTPASAGGLSRATSLCSVAQVRQAEEGGRQ